MKNKMRRLTVLALLAISSTIAMAQSKITGKIVEVNGEPIIGATVKVKGSAIGTVSDLDGNFTVEAEKGSELEVSYIGYKTQAVKVTGNYLEVKLLEDAKALSEVVVVGFGVQKKVNLTGAVSVVDGDELALSPMPPRHCKVLCPVCKSPQPAERSTLPRLSMCVVRPPSVRARAVHLSSSSTEWRATSTPSTLRTSRASQC